MLRTILRPASTLARGAVVLLHGRGADERDLAPLANALDPQRELAFAFPRGPLARPPGGAHWYALGGIGTPDRETFDATFPTLLKWLEALPEQTGVPLAQTVVGGFSQGAVMSYAVALAEDGPAIAGSVHLSGFIPTVEGSTIATARAAGRRFLVAHGAHDPIIGVEWGRAARDALTAAGADVTYREDPVAHTIAPTTLAALSDWLAATLPS